MASEFGSADPRLDMFADLGVLWPGLPVRLPPPPPSPISSLVTEPLLCDFGASEDFRLLRQADSGSFILSFFVTNFPAGNIRQSELQLSSLFTREDTATSPGHVKHIWVHLLHRAGQA